MPRPFNSIDDFIGLHHLSTARGRGGFRGRGRGSRASEPSQLLDAFSPPLDLEGLYTVDRGRGRGNGRGRGHQDDRGRGAQRGRAGGPSQSGRAVTRGGPPAVGRGTSKGTSNKGIINSTQDDDLLEVDFNDIAEIFGSLNPVPSRGGSNPRGQRRGRGQGGGFQNNAVHPPQSFNGRGRDHSSRSFQSQSGRGQAQRGGLELPRGKGRGNDRGTRGRGIGSFQSPNDDIDPDDLALRNLTLSSHGINPLLHPIGFVKSRNVLFQDHEEIFMPEVADSDTLDPSGPPPTADRVEALFHQGSTSVPPVQIATNKVSDPLGSKALFDSKNQHHALEKAGVKSSLTDSEDDDDIVLYTPISTRLIIPGAVKELSMKPSVESAPLSMPNTATSASTVITPMMAPLAAPQPGVVISGSVIADDPATVPRHGNSTSTAKRKRKRLLPTGNDEQRDGHPLSRNSRSKAFNINRRPLIRNSDVEWSTASDDDGIQNLISGLVEVDTANGDMDVDVDVDPVAYNAFVTKLSTPAALNQATIGDIEDQEKMDFEDDDDAWEDVSDSEPEPRNGVKPRVRRSSTDQDIDDEVDENGDHLFIAKFRWDDEDGADQGSIMRAETLQMLLEENEDILMGGRKTKKERRKLMKMIGDQGLLIDDAFMQGDKKSRSKKNQPLEHIPADLHQQWERNRQKKAENKRNRAEARRLAMEMEAAGPKIKRSKKLKIRLAESTDDDVMGPDPYDIENQIRSFVKDMSKTSLALPPMDRESRKHVHQLATSFRLKSVSKGQGNGRATTLTKTTHTGVVKEGKLAAQLRQWERVKEGETKGKTGKRVHREGDEVGKHAAKIDDSNVGYQLLQAMGWTDGDRIGVAGGLEAPLKAVFKSSKLGLGAL